MERRVAFPIVVRWIRHHAFHRRRGVVAFHSRSFAAVILRHDNGDPVRIEEKFMVVETHSNRWIESS